MFERIIVRPGGRRPSRPAPAALVTPVDNETADSGSAELAPDVAEVDDTGNETILETEDADDDDVADLVDAPDEADKE
jgi:hypothetical protein